jgi:uncharacterized protein YjbI with pentapeptide repeats
MANEEHLRQLKAGVDAWNAWRRHTGIKNPDLRSADLSQMKLWGINFEGVRLNGANLYETELVTATLIAADMASADLTEASLEHSNLWSANLSDAKLPGAVLLFTTLHSVYMERTDLTDVQFGETFFADLDLRNVIGLERCDHISRSSIDHRTLERSSPLPMSFLRGIGLPDAVIDYLPSLLNQPIQHYSSFISYSSNNDNFANRIHADLQNKGVRCWFAPHDMPIGGKILDEIDSAIRLRDKLLLILSEHSIKSDWVEDEVTKAFEEERKRGQTVLFPIRLDDAVMDTNEAWAAKLRARHIGDFRRWKEHDEYQKSFGRVLRDLTVKKP